MQNTHWNCRHCGEPMKKWRVPEGASWEEAFFFVCFNDECAYYKNGWEWMWDQFQQRASYRFAINPTDGSSLMIPVWSDMATREMIMEEGKGDAE